MLILMFLINDITINFSMFLSFYSTGAGYWHYVECMCLSIKA